MSNNKLQKDYEKFLKVQEKIDESAKALREAIKLAKLPKGKTLLDLSNDDFSDDEDDGTVTDSIINFDSLLNAMDKAGWQTSSFGCWS